MPILMPRSTSASPWRGNWDSAKRNLELAQGIDPQNAEVFETFALVYPSTGEFGLAEQQFMTALRAEPRLSRVRNNYAAFLPSRGRFTAPDSEFFLVSDDTL